MNTRCLLILMMAVAVCLVSAGVGGAVNLTFAGSYDAYDARGVAVSGNYAYVTNGDHGLVIIDISNPIAPASAGSYNAGYGYASGVAVSGSYA